MKEHAQETYYGTSDQTFYGNPFADEFRCESFLFQGMHACVVFPPEGTANGKWLLKTVYFGAFPELEMDLLRRGYHLAYIDGQSRWGLEADLACKADFIRHISAQYGLNPRCVPIGMSAGGCVALKLAAAYPELVSVLYLDAACVNLLSCPMGFGRSRCREMPELADEMLADLSLTRQSVLAYRSAPIDRLETLAQSRIPAVVVYGCEDKTVPYEENGALLEALYRREGLPLLVIAKAGCDHHPHGVPDDSPVIRFIETYDTDDLHERTKTFGQ